jgi:aminopeptidase N
MSFLFLQLPSIFLPYILDVVAHELAHQWFGNYTTMAWWDNLWLNEGFATFVGTMAVHHLFPEWDMFTQVMMQRGVMMSLPTLMQQSRQNRLARR